MAAISKVAAVHFSGLQVRVRPIRDAHAPSLDQSAIDAQPPFPNFTISRVVGKSGLPELSSVDVFNRSRLRERNL